MFATQASPDGFFAVGKYGTSTASVSHPEMPLAAPAE